ncbi:unnamed protein product [Schistosoma mattheei]|uniref:Uncharacterized protein n=1 Tax=Schistosoma mattheei TaxID=31246 RepID=A0A183PD66_9TREM|nr:unnamed protein product [Schistosoma mattheei]
MMVGSSQQETLDLSFVLFETCQQGVPVILMELMLLGGFSRVSLSVTVSDVTTDLLEPRQTHSDDFIDKCHNSSNSYKYKPVFH